MVGTKLERISRLIAHSPDVMTGGALLIDCLNVEIDLEYAALYILDTRSGSLTLQNRIDKEVAEISSIWESVTLSDPSNPLILSALSQSVIRSKGQRKVTDTGIRVDQQPKLNLLSIPFYQPCAPDIPRLDEAQLRLSLDHISFEAVSLPGYSEHKLGKSPAGVVALWTRKQLVQDRIAQLNNIVLHLGPVFWRLWLMDQIKHPDAHENPDARQMVLSLIDNLPDPVIIARVTDECTVEPLKDVIRNLRARELMSAGDNDSPKYKKVVQDNIREVEREARLYVASKTGDTSVTSPEIRLVRLVDPATFEDLIFEIHVNKAGDSGHLQIVVSLRDITSLQQAKTELENQINRVRLAEFDAKRERDRLTLILKNVSDPILVTDDLANVILMNREAEILFSTDNKVSRNLESASPAAVEAVHDAVRNNEEKFTKVIAEFTTSSDVYKRLQMILQHTTEDTPEFPVEVVAGKILDVAGRPIAIVSVLHDLTDKVENEWLYNELKKFNAELESRVHEATLDLAAQNARLHWQSKQLEQANRLKSDFLANMSHELRTPINAMIGYTGIMLDGIYGEITEQQRDGLNRMMSAARHLLALINDILDRAKIEAGQMPLHIEHVKLSEILKEVEVNTANLFRLKGLKFKLNVPPEDISLFTDRTKVKQILINLLSNAVKFTPVGSVTLNASVDDETLSLEVSDTGIGIRNRDLRKIWEDFRQVDQSRTREYGGTGLGLSITRKLIHVLGGAIYLRSEYGLGSTFIVNIPLKMDISSLEAEDID